MKFIVAFILTALLSYAAGLYFPWWSIAIAAFIVAALLPLKPLAAFTAAFSSVFIMWVILALSIDMNNNHLLSMKISEMLFKSHSHALIMSVTGLIGGLVAGFAALAGSYLRKSKAEQN
ncbi:MAG: hypothetical protein IPK31_18070 [Chitinophagaceae bacterium]|nr:hypothetical protein [Chitinophagaceae bacterium]